MDTDANGVPLPELPESWKPLSARFPDEPDFKPITPVDSSPNLRAAPIGGVNLEEDEPGKVAEITDLPVTTELPADLFYEPPTTVAELLLGGPSPLGHSRVSAFLGCPERGRLEILGVKPKPISTALTVFPLDHLAYGTLMHALLGYRILEGHMAAEALLGGFERLHPEDRIKALNQLRIYDLTYGRPVDEPWDYLGVESQVVTEIGDGDGGSIKRTVRYDAIIRPWERVLNPDGSEFLQASHGVLSLEKKTAARGGATAMTSYMSQFMVQVTLWNANPALVAKYGPMLGVIPDIIVKTVVPKVERIGPLYISKLQQQRTLEYLRLPNLIRYPTNADGSYPRYLHSCWGKWGPCPYISLCHEDARGSYDMPEGTLR